MTGSRLDLQRALEQLEREVVELDDEHLDELSFWFRYIPLVRQALALAGVSDDRWMRDRIADIEAMNGIVNPNLTKDRSSSA